MEPRGELTPLLNPARAYISISIGSMVKSVPFFCPANLRKRVIFIYNLSSFLI